MIQYDGFWFCNECNTENNGPNLICDLCGSDRPHGKDVFYPTSKNTNEKGSISLNTNKLPDWNCVACDAKNKSTIDTCWRCHTSKNEYSNLAIHNESDLNNFGNTTIQQINKENEITIPYNSSNNIRYIKYISSGIGFLLVVFSLWWLFVPEEMTLKSIHCDVISVKHEMIPTKKEGWILPNNAYNSSSTTKHTGRYRDVFSHYVTAWKDTTYVIGTKEVCNTITSASECGVDRIQTGTQTKNLGNGTFIDEPIYKETPRTCNVCIDKDITKTEQVSYQKPIYNQEPIYVNYYYYTVDIKTEVDRLSCHYTDKNYHECKVGSGWKSDFKFYFNFEDKTISVNKQIYDRSVLNNVYLVSKMGGIKEKK